MPFPIIFHNFWTAAFLVLLCFVNLKGSLALWGMYVIVLRRWMQEDKKFKARLDYKINLRPARIRESMSQNKFKV